MTAIQTSLFTDPKVNRAQCAPLNSGRGFTLRDYQTEDCDEVCRQWSLGNKKVLCVHATGLGKAVIAAELAGRKPEGTRALILVDSTDLAMDLFKTVKMHLKCKPAILTGEYKENEQADILIATKQCLCAGDRYLYFDWTEFSTLIVDECEAALANDYLLLITHIIERQPDINVCGLTATPLPAGNRNITDLFGYAAKEPGPLYRDLQWAYTNGWLVKPMQGVLRCSLDFTTLKVRKRENGEEDYSDRDIAKLMLMQDEREWLELAGGIHRISRGHVCIVVCPNMTAIADKLAGYIEGHARARGERGICYSIHRGLGQRRSWDLMRRFKAGEFPIAVSVKMFEKGFDYDKVSMIVMARRTKSLRLYTQIAGRGGRPLTEIRDRLHWYPNRNARMRLISQSDKPSCVVVDCVGINDDAKNILGVIDILGRGVRGDIKERVGRYSLDKARAQAEAQEKGETLADEAPGDDVGNQARRAAGELLLEWERNRETRAAVSADVDVSYEVDTHGRKNRARKVGKTHIERGDSSAKQAKLLIALGISPERALASSRKQAGVLIGVQKKKHAEANWLRVRAWERRYGKIK